MNVFFRRQLAEYVEYHRNPINCVLHVFGILFLFLAAVLPLTLWPTTVLSIQTNAATFMVLPVLVYWGLLDVIIGLTLAGTTIALLLMASVISSHASISTVWITSIVLLVVGSAAQIIGHNVFEARRPALVDHPTHLLLGPMFVTAKLFVALRVRSDLAVIIDPESQPMANDWLAYKHQHRSNGGRDR